MAGTEDQETTRVRAKVATQTDSLTLMELVERNAAHGAAVSTDEVKGYTPLPTLKNGYRHEPMRSSVLALCNQLNNNELTLFIS